MDKKDFIEKSSQKHNNKYDYSLVPQKINLKQKINIICPYHGKFEQIGSNHKRGAECPFCIRERNKNINRKTTKEFIQDANKIHGNYYDYSKSEYKTAHDKLSIICPKHGEFYMSPKDHLNHRGCSECKKDKIIEMNTQYDTEKFIKMCKKIHNNKYDYSKTEYTKDGAKVIITCPEHGDFNQTPNDHKYGRGCPECGKISRFKNNRKGINFFIEKSKEVHGDYYDYSKTYLMNQRDKVTIICPKHGEFKQIAYYHLNGNGCPKCNMSRGEMGIKKVLEKHNINYEHQKRFESLGLLYSFDFFLPDYDIIIEFDGIQHYQPTNFFQQYTQEEMKERFEIQKQSDRIKNEWCKKNGYKIIRIPYYEKDIEKFIENNIEYT